MLQRFLTTEKLASDLFWDQMGVDAGRYWLLYSLRPQVQPLANKLLDQPALLWRKFTRILHRHVRKLTKDRQGAENLSWYKLFCQLVEKDLVRVIPESASTGAQNHSGALPRIPEQFSSRQIAALGRLLPVWGFPYTGRPLTDSDPKDVVNAVRVLTAHPPGSKRKENYDKAYELQKSGMTADEICKKLNLYPPASKYPPESNYAPGSQELKALRALKSFERKSARRDVLSACRYRRIKEQNEQGVRKPHA
jgi:hypothetical protein